MKKIVGLRAAQREYKRWLENDTTMLFYFRPSDGKLICDCCQDSVCASLRISYHNERGFRLLDVNKLIRRYGEYGIRALFAQIKKIIGQNWPEYAKFAEKAQATITKVDKQREKDHPKRSFWADFE